MLYIGFEDLVMKRAKTDRIAKNTRRITNLVLWSGLGYLVGTGVIGVKLIGECLVIGGVNKVTKWVIKNRKSLVKHRVET